ncbi:DMT family transporter [Corynebacterium sp. ES2715-CONJ3]|uniref:DMT family transporter n=1 Tax=Corynebacterium sp. ES2715-CONJ3 TaxID=2974028 RepID=UPI00286EAF10|nr:DMT family transporter [Corynebacterium sp. ES2715-CONJ3]
MINSSKNRAIGLAILAAALYALSAPAAKVLLLQVDPTMLAGLLYLGAGVGMGVITTVGLSRKLAQAEPFDRTDVPFVVAMVVLDIAAPILLVWGLSLTTPATTSLLNNFEIVATSLIAWVIFKEVLSRKLTIAIVLLTLASILLTVEATDFRLNWGAVLVLGACTCWGLENNCTARLSSKNPAHIVTIKGIFSGLGSLIIALAIGEGAPPWLWVILAMLLGFISYGLSITTYILAQKHLGAAKTSAYYAVAPFLGVAFSFVIFGEKPAWNFYAALGIMVIATWLLIRDSIGLQHSHQHGHEHTHSHRHANGLLHSHAHVHHHDHRHIHPREEADIAMESHTISHTHTWLDRPHSHEDHH